MGGIGETVVPDVACCLEVLGDGGLNVPFSIPSSIASGHFKP